MTTHLAEVRDFSLCAIIDVLAVQDRQDSPLSQASELCLGCPGLIPPHDSRQDRGQSKTGESAHENIAVLIVALKCIKDAEEYEADRRKESHEQSQDARGLPPIGITSEPVKAGRVPHMVDSEDRAGEGDAGDGAARDEHGLEVESCYVADEGDLWIDLAGISWLADCQPSEEEDGEGRKPGNACHERENPKLARMRDVGSEDSGPESSRHACQFFLAQLQSSLQIREFRALRM